MSDGPKGENSTITNDYSIESSLLLFEDLSETESDLGKKSSEVKGLQQV